MDYRTGDTLTAPPNMKVSLVPVTSYWESRSRE